MLHAAGFRWLATRSRCETGKAVRKRRTGKILSPTSMPKRKKRIERAYGEGKVLGLTVWGAQGQACRQPHENVRNGTAKLLTLFCPRSGELRAKGVTSASNAALHLCTRR